MPSSIRVLAIALTLLTGFTGLVYEVVWQRYVGTLLGSDSAATAAVLGLFLGGLALGYATFGRLTRRRLEAAVRSGRPARLLLDYAVVEAAIGAWAWLFPWAFEAVRALSLALPVAQGVLAFVLDVALSALLVVPPAFLMGATVPVLTQALARSVEDSTRVHAWIYGINTAGAMAGALAAGFALIPLLGLDASLRWMGSLNLGAGAVFALAGWRAGAGASPVPLEGPAAREGEGGSASRLPDFALLAAVALLSGFAMMTVQTVFMRLGALCLGSSTFTFSMVVAVFVAAIAIGSLTISALRRIPAAVLPLSQWLLLLLLSGLFLLGPRLPWAAHVLRTVFRDTDAAFHAFHAATFLSLLALLIVPIGLSGALLPLLFHALRREVGDLGATAGRLYAWNTVGSLLGALLGGYALLLWLDLDGVLRTALLAVAACAVLVTVRQLELQSRVGAAVGLAMLLAGLVLLPAWDYRDMAAGAFRLRVPTASSYAGPAALAAELNGKRQLEFHDDDPDATVAVWTVAGQRTVVTNGKTDGNTGSDFETMSLAGLIPAVLAEDCKRAFVIGWGLGVTAGELASLDCTEEVVAAEISRAVLEAAPLFDDWTQAASRNPKVRTIRGDAYRALLRSEGRFDVIVSEPSNPWVTGVENIFSREFLEAARARLAPGGIYAQWLQRYEMDEATLQLVLRTYASVFDRFAVWYTLPQDLVLLGFADDQAVVDLERAARRVARPDFDAALRRAGIAGLAPLVAHELVPAGVLTRERLPGPIHTLGHPRLAYAASRAFYEAPTLARVPRFVTPQAVAAGARIASVRRLILGAGDERDRVRAAIVRETCENMVEECMTLLGQWTALAPESLELQAEVAHARKNPLMAGPLSRGLHRELARLFDPQGRSLPERVTPAEAKAWERRFHTHYHLAAPFAPRALGEVWQRCVAADPAICDQGFAAMRSNLFPFAARGPADRGS